MGKLFSIGEVLIDFIPHEKGVALKDVLSGISALPTLQEVEALIIENN
nr:hypothetical protein [Neobacillus sp. Marseille-Q6967]